MHFAAVFFESYRKRLFLRRERNYMPNFIFISPAFPGNYENFCVALRANGVNVLGIGDTPYDCLSPRLKSALTEYYRVENMENYDEMFRAVAFLSFHHGKIDYLESNNEYWLTQDARLREDFHITTGLQPKDMDLIKYKSKMKAGYEKAGIPCARYHLISDLTSAQNFIREVGYPVIVKPDCGVGANDTWKLTCEAELLDFFRHLPSIPYIMEEYVPGEICSYDAIVNSKGSPLFETGNITPISIMDCVNDHNSIKFYIVDQLAEDLKTCGRACLKAFKVHRRFVHLEFFRLLEDHPYLGKKGQVVKVNDGYARNFILPKKLGVEATSKNLNDLKLQKANAEKVAAEQLAEAKKLAEEIDKMSVTVSIKAGEGGRAFGSVSTKEIAKAAKDQLKLDIDKKKMVLPEPIKSIGSFEVPIKLHKEVTARLSVKVVEA